MRHGASFSRRVLQSSALNTLAALVDSIVNPAAVAKWCAWTDWRGADFKSKTF
jgi:hypothetical protein